MKFKKNIIFTFILISFLFIGYKVNAEGIILYKNGNQLESCTDCRTLVLPRTEYITDVRIDYGPSINFTSGSSVKGIADISFNGPPLVPLDTMNSCTFYIDINPFSSSLSRNYYTQEGTRDYESGFHMETNFLPVNGNSFTSNAYFICNITNDSVGKAVNFVGVQFAMAVEGGDIPSSISNAANSINQNNDANTNTIMGGISQGNQNLSDILSENQDSNDKLDEINQGISQGNQNLEDLINGEKVCSVYDISNILEFGKYLSSSGELVSNGFYGVTDYILINSSSNIKVVTDKYGFAPSTCFYNINKNLISCIPNSQLFNGYDFIIPSNASFVRFSIEKNENRPQFKICNLGNQIIYDSMNDNNTSGANGSADGFFSSFGNDSYNGLEDVISAPLSFINNMNSACSPISVTIPRMNYTFELPCIQSYLASIARGNQSFSNLLLIAKYIVNGFICYRCLASLFLFFHDMKDPHADDLEVLDL